MLIILGISMLKRKEININRFQPGYDYNTEAEYKKHEKIAGKAELPLWKTLVMILCGGVTTSIVAYTIIGKWWVSVIAFITGFTIPKIWYEWHLKSQAKLVSSQMEQAVEIMAAVLNSSGSIITALEKAGNEVGNPVKREIMKTASEIRLGKSTTDAFTDLAKRIKIPEMLILSMGVDLQNKGMAINLPSMLLQVQRNIRYRQLFEQDINTITAENKMSAFIVAAVPFVVIALMRQIAPDFISPLFETTAGLTVFVICTLAIFAGIYWILNMIEAIKN